MAAHLTWSLLSVVVAQLVSKVQGHGWLVAPASRNQQAFERGLHYCPHCGQGAYPARKAAPSICGDPYQDVYLKTAFNWAGFTPYTNRFFEYSYYTSGQVIDVEIAIDTNHFGRMRLSLCPLSKDKVTQDCFDKKENMLKRVSGNPDENGKLFFYMPKDPRATSLKAKFKLPDGVACENGCMLQWQWWGYQSCFWPCQDKSMDVPGQCGYSPQSPYYKPCTSPQQSELYYNCVDVVIKKTAGSKPTPKPAPNPSPKPATKPGPQGSSPAKPPSSFPTSQQCPVKDPRCQTCSNSANTAAKRLLGDCFTCARGKGGDDCYSCMRSSHDGNIMKGCLGCVSQGGSWRCAAFCSSIAVSPEQNAACTACVLTPGIDKTGCQLCVAGNESGDVARTKQCLSCVQKGIPNRFCEACNRKHTSATRSTCYTCVANAKTVQARKQCTA